MRTLADFSKSVYDTFGARIYTSITFANISNSASVTFDDNDFRGSGSKIDRNRCICVSHLEHAFR